MQVVIDYAREHAEYAVAEARLIAVERQAPPQPLTDPLAAIRHALEEPARFPALRRALTPDDNVVVVVDHAMPRNIDLLVPIVEHLQQAGVSRSAITLLFASPDSRRRWTEPADERLAGLAVDVHDSADRRKLAYLATTKTGRRVYLNRSAVDADQVVVLTRRGYDPLLGYAGAAGALYPALSDEETQHEICGRLSMTVPGSHLWPVRKEADEVAWLLGAPFFVQIVEGPGDAIAHVVGGLTDTSAQAERLLDASWRVNISRSANTVVAAISGEAGKIEFIDLARAVACASRVVQPNGRIALLVGAAPALVAGGNFLRQAESAEEALTQLRQQPQPDIAAYLWASAARQASVFLLSGYPNETAEELFATPLEHARQVQRLIDAGESCVFLPDAHKMMAVIT